MNLNVSSTKNEVAKDFANYFAKVCASKPEVHIALSGGSTPKVVFDELAANYQETIDWSKVHLYWGDERCVWPDDDESNYKMTNEHLLSKIKIPELNIHRIKGENGPKYEAAHYSEFLNVVLPKTNALPTFDLVILGIGDDGHTASIFPNQIKLWHSKKYCEVAKHPVSGQKRITITGQIINNAKIVAFLVTGAGKADRISEIIKGEEIAKKYPVSLVKPTDGKVVWYLDEAAAAGITSTQS
ncbi:6-phosphogluconolactonase [Aurantibacter crassamenti]|uniref:6-phosphogluconolactonase n=1 Tax=Aurantibacter crassamenti TaxID=1837375 RepID=UPI00193A12FF|nr:6-phosphogluconolactonase [Aurantibacter crassamenti]MBM1107586.1 6-phosphogluconolactonase [Aurantibacter crassamenti]